jgi:hypothetical protein
VRLGGASLELGAGKRDGHGHTAPGQVK